MNDSHREEIAKLETLYASNPEGRVFTHLAEAYRKAGELDRARTILDTGLERHPDYASAHVVRGRVLADAGDESGSAAEFRRVLELDRHNLVALRSLGDLAAGHGNAEEALRYYDELAVLDPSDMVIQEEIRRFRQLVDQTRTFEPPTQPETAIDTGEPSPSPAEPAEPEAPAAEAASEAEPASEAAEPASEAAAQPTDADAGSSIQAAPIGSPFSEAGATEPEAASETTPGEAGESAESLTEEQEAERALEQQTASPVSLEGLEVPETPMAGPGDEDEASFAGIVVEGMDELVPTDLAGIETPGTPSAEAAADEAGPEAEAGEDVAGPLPDETAEPAAEAESAEAEPVADSTTEEAGWPAGEGRWEAQAADDDAERARETREDTGEWIPSDRWKWVAASAGEEMPAPPEADESTEAEPEPIVPPDWLDSAEPTEVEVEVEEASGEMEDVGLTLDAEFAEALARPVDSFEEGAADVLKAAGLIEPEETAAATFEGPPPGPEDEVAGEEFGESDWEEMDDSGDLVITETLAEIYASQGLTDRAVSVYRRLVREHPHDDRLRVRLADLESGLESAAAGAFEEAEPEAGIEAAPDVDDREAFVARVESAFTGGEGAAGEEETPYAWARTEAAEEADGQRIGDYFRTLLAWRPTNPDVLPGSAGEVAAGETGSEFAEWAGSGAEPVKPEREGESDEDLEMFRSWLKSLKK